MTEQTKICKSCSGNLPVSCFYKNGSRLFSMCKSCISLQRKARYENESETLKSRVRQYRSTNKEKCNAAVKRWTDENKALVLQKAKERSKEYRKAFPHKGTQQNQKRRAKTKAPKFANVAKINAIYAYSAMLKKTTGIEHHVDHIVPINGKTVSGLHVEWNLKVVTREENLAKAAKLTDPFAPCELDNPHFQQWISTN